MEVNIPFLPWSNPSSTEVEEAICKETSHEARIAGFVSQKLTKTKRWWCTWNNAYLCTYIYIFIYIHIMYILSIYSPSCWYHAYSRLESLLCKFCWRGASTQMQHLFGSRGDAEIGRATSVEAWFCVQISGNDTVDGWNPAPVAMVNIPLFTGFSISQGVQDFFHQQYGCFQK